jgi:membrane protein
MTDEAAELEPEREEPRLEDPGPTDHSKRNYLAILKRAFKSASEDHVTSLAAALAYYAFLAIPATLLIAAGIFGLVAGPDAVDTLIDKLHGIVPAEVTDLVRGSLNRLTRRRAPASR